jgi:hypothetical protein
MNIPRYTTKNYTGPNGVSVDKLDRDTLEQELCHAYCLCERILHDWTAGSLHGIEAQLQSMDAWINDRDVHEKPNS